ncbi:hypothetical protein ACFQ21_22020 [Ohtaekwangia kribbensis]|jgi:hypothetical protein|uniref:Uncharacterized protein n=1 Tax=Ohtaekwangia kribbensis TaxID=688913 RepID=A0ABW3K7J2_9BACT
MTKSKYILLLLCMLALAEVRCQSPNAVKQVEYTTLTRGYQKHIIISPDSLTITVEGREENKSTARALSKDEWRRLMDCLKKVKLSEIPELKSPTMKRTYDGARHSTLTLITNETTSVTHSFDNEDANEKLLPLMKAILKIEGLPDAEK